MKTRILGIAPYEGMRTLMEQLASGMDDVELTAFVGDLEPGAKIAETYTARDIDVILSRGGTAELIRQSMPLPVIEIELSVYDILRSIRLAEASNSSYAVVGFTAITRNAQFLCDMLQYRNVEVVTIHNEAEARQALKTLAEKHCEMVLCDMITNSLAHEYGIPALLIASGTESVEAALRKAVRVSQLYQPLREYSKVLESTLAAQAHETVIFHEDGSEVLRTVKGLLPLAVEARLAACHEAVLAGEAKRSTITVDGRQYMLSGRRIHTDKQRYSAIEITSSGVRPGIEKYGIRYMDKEEALDLFFSSFYGATQSADMQGFERYAVSDEPLMLVGERGTGTNQMARFIYGKSKFQNAPLCVIDCTLLQQKGWTYLMENDASPLADIGITLYFQHITDLSQPQFVQLFTTMMDTHFHQRNRLIFDCALDEQNGMSEKHQQLLVWFHCTLVSLSPLRERKEDIPHLASLYIAMLNMRKAREIVGVEPDALKSLMEYDWPANYDQFKRVLKELTMTASSPYITESSVHRVLRREEMMFPSQSAVAASTALGGKTLDEIERIAVRQALTEEKGNQRAAAQRLGISRTTLWRMLQREEKDAPANTPE